jgi:methionyl aminopeptidase
MAAIIKSQAEREKIRETGHIVAQVLAELRAAVRPGITTIELDRLAVEALKQRGAKSSSLGYHGYPKSVCTSVNDEVVHGIPGEQVLQEGDIVSVDFAAVYNGWHADSAITVAVGTVSPEVQRLLKVTEDALYRGIAVARAGNRLNDISRAVQEYVEAGMVIAIEPMVNMGSKETRVLADDWTVVTADDSYSAHFEHTVAITEGDADILTV